MSQPVTQMYEVYIRTTPQKLWDAITKSEYTRQYFFGGDVQSDFAKGSPYKYTFADGDPMHGGEIVEVDPPHKLVTTFVSQYGDDAQKDEPSRVTWQISQFGETCKLTLTHEHYSGQTATVEGTARGWQMVLSALKTLLETGKPLELPSMEAATA